jgi:PAS domain S-box-containing protein
MSKSEPLPTPSDEQWWAPLVSVSLDGQFVLKPRDAELTEFEIQFANEPGSRMVGLAPEALIGRMLSDVMPPYGTGFRDALQEAFRTHETVYRLTEDIGPTLDSRRAEYRVQRFGDLLALSVIDRTAEFDAEAESRLLRKLLTAGIEASLTAVALLRPIFGEPDNTMIDVEFVLANDAAAAIVGRSRSDVVGQKMYSLIPRTNGDVLKIIEACRTSGQMLAVDYDARDSPLRAHWLRFQLLPVGDMVLIYAEDVSVQRREEVTLHTIVEYAAELVAYSDQRGAIQYVNPFTVAALGYPQEYFIGKSIADFALPADRPGVIADHLNLLNGTSEVARRRISLLDSSGRLRTMFGSTRMLRSASGSVDGFVTVAADLTERLANQEAREQLAAELSMAEQHERERLAGELHDGPVQVLAAVSMQLGAAKAKHPAVELQHAEDMVVQVLSDLRTLMFELSPPELEGAGLGQAILVRGVRLFDGTNVTVTVDASLTRPPSPATSVIVFRLAQEALVNARKHANAKTVKVRLFEDEQRGTIVLEIVDDGQGATASQYERNVPGHFGIAMMVDRARQLGGVCSIEGVPGRGTRVRVELPQASF